MEKTEKDSRKKGPRFSRTGDRRRPSFQEVLKQAGAWSLALFQEKAVLLLFFGLFVVWVHAPSLFLPAPDFRLGEISRHNLKASKDMFLEDEAMTEKKRQEAAQGVLTVYDFDEKINLELQKKIRSGFLAMREALKKEGPLAGVKAVEARRRLERIWGVEVSSAEFSFLANQRFSEAVEDTLIQLVQSVMAVGVVQNKLDLMGEEGKGIVVRKPASQIEFRVQEVERFPDLNDARDRLEKRSVYLVPAKNKEFRPLAVALAQKLIVPNLSPNKSETEERIRKAVREVRPVLFRINKGEWLIRTGERVTEDHLLKIRMELGQRKGLPVLWTSLGWALLWGLLLFMVYYTAQKGKMGWAKAASKLHDLVFLAILLALSILGIRTADLLAQTQGGNSSWLSDQVFLFALPIAAGPMMISLVLNPSVAFVFALVQSFSVLTFWVGSQEAVFYFALAGLWASLARVFCHNRWDLFRMGSYLGLIQTSVVLIFQLLQGRLIHWETPALLLSAFGGGILAGIIVTGFSPLIERIFGYTTEMKLLEWANMDQPLLRELMVQAPGTYHHSIIVGNMVEAAAEAIGANTLLARVGAYYHDIGKLRKPLYFVENQMGGENKHEKLAPSMSALILIAHVKDGVELARQYKLDAPIIDIIREHHGTGLISFFYQKCLDLKGGDASQVSMDDFRYPGPKPQTREAGLVLLADGIEAASRTLVDPTPARIQGLVVKIIQNAFVDGQLDECELTLKDLALISASFTKILTGIFHHRIEYPETALKGGGGRKKINGDTDKQPPEADRSRQDLENLLANLKSLGAF